MLTLVPEVLSVLRALWVIIHGLIMAIKKSTSAKKYHQDTLDALSIAIEKKDTSALERLLESE